MAGTAAVLSRSNTLAASDCLCKRSVCGYSQCHDKLPAPAIRHRPQDSSPRPAKSSSGPNPANPDILITEFKGPGPGSWSGDPGPPPFPYATGQYKPIRRKLSVCHRGRVDKAAGWIGRESQHAHFGQRLKAPLRSLGTRIFMRTCSRILDSGGIQGLSRWGGIFGARLSRHRQGSGVVYATARPRRNRGSR